MATLGGDLLTLAEIAKREDPNGMPALIAEVLSESMPILEDIPWVPSNLPTAHRSTVRTGLPTVALRRINQGVASSRSTTSQIEDSMSLIEAWSTVDKKLLDISGNQAATRVNEGRAFIEAMGQKCVELLIDGSVADDDLEFNGMAIRDAYSTLGDQCLSAGGTGSDLSSIWMIGWAPDKIFGIYPKNTTGGLQHEDHGLQVVQETTDLPGAKLAAYMDQWMWDCGLVVKDDRFAVRIANIENADVTGVSGTQETADYATNIMYLMARAMHRIPNLASCRPCFYMPRTIYEGIHVQALAQASGALKIHAGGTGTTGADTAHAGGKGGTSGWHASRGPVISFEGVPLKVLDHLGYAESAIS